MVVSGISEGDVGDSRRMVGLHVRDNKVVQAPAAQLVGQVLEEIVANGLIDGVKEDGLFVFNKVGVVGNAVRHSVDTLEEGEASVVRADPVPYRLLYAWCNTLYITSYVFLRMVYILSPSEKLSIAFPLCALRRVDYRDAFGLEHVAMRSASAKFLAFFAAARSASRPSMRGSDSWGSFSCGALRLPL